MAFRRMKEKKARLKQQKDQLMQLKQINQNLIEKFKEDFTACKTLLESEYNTSKTLLQALAVGEKFNEVALAIDRNGTLNNPNYSSFINFVRTANREIQAQLGSYKDQFQADNPEIPREKKKPELAFLEKTLPNLLHALKESITPIEAPEAHQGKAENITIKSKEAILIYNYQQKFNEQAPLYLTVKSWFAEPEYPEDEKKNFLKISIFREKYFEFISEEDKKSLQIELVLREETRILQKTIEYWDANLHEFENLGFYKHVKDSGAQWVKKLNEISQDLPSLIDNSSITEVLQGEIEHHLKYLNEWLRRVDMKYQNPRKIALDEPEVDTDQLKQDLGLYSIARNYYIQKEQDRKILDYIDSKSFNAKDQFKAIFKERNQARKQKEKEIIAENKAISQKQQQKLREKQEKLLAKQKAKEEAEKKKAEEAAAKKAKELEEKRQAEEQANKQKAEEAEKQKKVEEAKKKADLEEKQKAEKETKKKAEKLALQKQKEEEQKKKTAEEAAKQKAKEEEKQRLKEKESAAKKKAEEETAAEKAAIEAQKKAEEEEKQRLKQEEAEKARKKQSEAEIEVEIAKKKAAIEAQKKAEEEEKQRLKQEEEKKQSKMASASEKLKQDFEQKIQIIKADKSLTKDQRSQKILELTKWRSEQEVKILTQDTGKQEKKSAKELAEEEERIRNEEAQALADEEANANKPLLAALQPDEIDRIWEFYFLHGYNRPNPDEFYGADEGKAKQYILQMLQQIIEHYSKIDSKLLLRERVKGDSKLYFIGESTFKDTDILLSKFFQTKIFESQATDNPLRIVFLGNYINGNPMDLHNLLYLIAFNLAYPREVLLLRGEHEEEGKLKQLGFDDIVLQFFDKEVLQKFQSLLIKLPPAYYVESDYQNVFACHGGIPLNPKKTEEAIKLENMSFEPAFALKKMDNLTKQLIGNEPSPKMNKKDFAKRDDFPAYRYSEKMFTEFLAVNTIHTPEIPGLVVDSHYYNKDGSSEFWGNLQISIFSTTEYKDQFIKSKILEVILPADPEYPEEMYDEEEEEEDEYEEEDEDEEEEDAESDEELIEEEEIDESKLVHINLLDINSM